MTSGLSQLIPDVQPVTILLINLLATDLDLDVLDQNVANPVQPPESLVVGNRDIRQLDTQVHTVDQITVTGNSAGDLLAPVAGAVESLLDRFHREVSVTTVNAAYPLLSQGAGLYLKLSLEMVRLLKPTDI